MNFPIFYQAPPKISLIHKFKKLFLFLFLFLFNSICFAEAIVHSNINGLSTFKDTSSGLTWLRLDNFLDISVRSQLSSAEAAGFTWAQKSEVTSLLNTLDISSTSNWDALASIIGRAPNRELFWGAYRPTGTTAADHGWGYAYRSSNWSYTDDPNYTIDQIPNSGTTPSQADLNLWAYFIGRSAAHTHSSMQYQARQLRSAFNTQTVAANFALNYDCNVFDAKGMCISAGGRYTTIDNPGINHSAAVVTLGYKVNPNIRIGAYLDQNINISNPTGINISNNTPLMGAYAVWNKEQGGLGYQVRVANTYQDKDVTSTRTVFNTSEAGSGKSSLTSQSYLAELSYAFQYQDKTLVRPYAGLRYTHLKQKGYTEDTTDTVTDPLTVAALRDKGITALLGLKINRSLTEKATLTAQLGLEQDVHHNVGNYSATNSDIGNLDSVAFNSNIKRTRPVASIGAFYDVTKTQRASATINYQQLPFQSTDSTTAYFNYMIGF
jgi:hypothetical protein